MLYEHNDIVYRLSRIRLLLILFAYYLLALRKSSVFNTELMSALVPVGHCWLPAIECWVAAWVFVSVDAGKVYRHVLKNMS